MKVRVIGCHGSVEPGYQTTCYWINDRFLIDCGSACSTFTPAEQAKVNDIFITHPHLDHVKDICFLIENSANATRDQLILRSSPEILKSVHDHVFNDVIWPDFSKISLGEHREKALMSFVPLDKNLSHLLDGVKVQAFRVQHVGQALGYLIDDGQSQVIFTGDTGPCPAIWKLANQCKNLKAVYTEISFPSRLDELARVSGHYTLAQLLADLTHFANTKVPIYISHFKPQFLEELLNEFHSKRSDQLQLMHEQDEFVFP